MSLFTLAPFIAEIDGSLLTPSLVAAVVGGVAAVAAPWLAKKLEASSAARLKELDHQQQFYDDLRASYNQVCQTLEDVRAELAQAQQINLDLQRASLEREAERKALWSRMESIQEDMEDFRARLDHHLEGHPAADELSRMAVEILDRIRRGRREAS